MKKHDIVLLSTADWDNPFWTNKQHVADQLSSIGHRVLYIDSLGLRRPSASARDLKRIGRRIAKAIGKPKQVRDNIWVWSPIILPWHNNFLVRSFNRLALRAGLFVWMKILGFKRDWLWTYSPLTKEFIDISSFKNKIYHCVDEIKAQPGMPSGLLEIAEKKLAEEVDVIFTTSPKLTETRTQWNSNTFYFSNVADYDHFHLAAHEDTKVPLDLQKIPGKKIGFIGAISGYKVDFELLRFVAMSRPDWSIVLIGEVGEGDPWTDCSVLRQLPNIHFLGPRSYKELPAYLKGFDVAILPSTINEYTDSMFPMKFFEYLAAGCPIVSVELKAIQEFRQVAFLSSSYEDFVSNLESAIGGAGAPLSERLEVAGGYTYRTRTMRMIDIVERGASV